MKLLRVIVLTIGVMTAGLWTPAWSAPTQPLPKFLINPLDSDMIYLAQQKSLVKDALEKDKKAQEDLWEDEDAFSEEDAEELTIADPLYYFNKGIWHFNDFVYLRLGEPAARGYNYVIPETVRGGIRNFFSNLYTPVRLVSCLLQAKWEQAGTETGRLLINSTFGILGFADMAKEEEWTGWEVAEEDMGQAFGAWGIGHGFYLVLPLVGPSSARDGVGRLANSYLDPIDWLDIKFWEYAAIWGYREFNNYSFYEGEYTKFREMSLDPYTAMRNAYIQFRARQVAE
jgi:phospholipid-binding lipoprotein MlaA